MRHRIDHAFRVLFIVSLSFSFAACSNSLDSAIKSQHTHPANKCIDAVSHAHLNGKKEHLHHFHFCEVTEKNSNAHSHPSTSITGFTRHVHPNGANDHTHVR